MKHNEACPCLSRWYENWEFRSEMPVDPSWLPFGLPTEWVGRETDEGIEIVCDSLSEQWQEMLRVACSE